MQRNFEPCVPGTSIFGQPRGRAADTLDAAAWCIPFTATADALATAGLAAAARAVGNAAIFAFAASAFAAFAAAAFAAAAFAAAVFAAAVSPVAQPTAAFALAAAAATQPTAAVSVATRCFAALPPHPPGRWRQLNSAGATSTQSSRKRKLIPGSM